MQSAASRNPWPTPPAPGAPEPPFVLDLPYDHVRGFLPGLRLALYSVVTNNAWGQQLAGLSDEQLLTTWRVMDSFEAVPLEQPFALYLPMVDTM